MKPRKNNSIRHVLSVLSGVREKVYYPVQFFDPPLTDEEKNKFTHIAHQALKALDEQHGRRAKIVVPMMMFYSAVTGMIDYFKTLREELK